MMTSIRHALLPIAATIALIGCTSGSEAVPVPLPGADNVVTAPVVSIELPAADNTIAPGSETGIDTETGTEDPGAADSDDPPPTDAEAPTTTQASPPVPDAAPVDPPPATDAPVATDAAPDIVYLRIGDEGSEVGLMQLKLSVLDYLPPGSDSGVFDQATALGLRQFQADYGLGVDGVFGPLTDRALNAAAQSVSVES